MRRGSAFSTIVVCAVATAGDAEAKLDLYIDKSMQQMSVIRNGALLYAWPVSTGLDRFSTPSGVYTPERLEPIWYSKAYNVPMPHAIFFHHGYAIHGSYDIAQLGGPASHGCVRLHPQEAALLFAMVEQEGPGNTTIVVGGGPPAPLPPRRRDWDEPPRPPYVRDSAVPPGAYPPNPGMPPYYNPYHYVDGPERRRGDDGRSAMREAYPNRPPPPRLDPQVPMEPPLAAGYRPPPPRLDAQVPMEPPLAAGYRPPPPRLDAQVPMEPPLAAGGGYRPPASRFDAQAPIQPTVPPRGRYRPPVPAPVTAKPNSKCPTCAPNHPSNEPANGSASANPPAKSPLPSPLSASMHLPSAPSGSAQSPWPRSASTQLSSPPSASPPPPPAQPASPSASPSPPTPAASSPPTASQSPEPQQSGLRYKVLPSSYWAGASWRWRLKAEHEISAPDSQ
jgi:L,D-transpeptidase catalytic domain